MIPAAPDTRALRRWLCEACGLVYDEARGDPDSGLAPGTRFEDIPEDWTCPVCGVGKSDFRPIEPPSAGAARRPSSAPNRTSADSQAAGAGPDSHAVIIVGAGLAGWSSGWVRCAPPKCNVRWSAAPTATARRSKNGCGPTRHGLTKRAMPAENCGPKCSTARAKLCLSYCVTVLTMGYGLKWQTPANMQFWAERSIHGRRSSGVTCKSNSPPAQSS